MAGCDTLRVYMGWATRIEGLFGASINEETMS